MKIAIIGWGSLIWKPDNLKFDINLSWSLNGPELPIEFARISNDGRLTLVITEGVNEVKTLYAISTFETIEQSRFNLATREKTNLSSIGFYIKKNEQISPNNFRYVKNIEKWFEINNNIDAVIWTNLQENWSNKTIFNDRIEYLLSLDKTKSEIAKEYICNTPEQIKTKLRIKIEEELGWKFMQNVL